MRKTTAVIGILAVLGFSACSVESTGDDPIVFDKRGSAASDEVGIFPATALTTEETGVTRWITHIGSAGEARILGVGADDIVKMQMAIAATETEVVVESILPAVGVRRVSADGSVLEDSLPPSFAGIYFSRDLAPEAAVGEESAEYARLAGAGNAELMNHTSLGCITAVAAAALVCATAETGVGALACAIALAAATAACTGGHCDQIQCNGDCTAGGHLYGWCASDPERCVCYEATGSSGGGDEPPPPGGGSSGGGGTCTWCDCYGEWTEYHGSVCGSTSLQLIDTCWDSCF